MRETKDAMLAPLVNITLDRVEPAVGETIFDIGTGAKLGVSARVS